MKTFIFISPHFPENYWRFARGLKKRGFNVLGIGNAPYHELSRDLLDQLTEYYYCPDMENYPSLYRAVAFFAFKYGKVDYLESNNEYWLLSDAHLRTDFNIKMGPNDDYIMRIKKKSEMKKFFALADVPTAKFVLVDTIENCQNFINEVGYPVFVKPNIGVGANDTYNIKNDDDLRAFFQNKPTPIEFIMEEYIDGIIMSYDGVCDAKGDIVFAASNIFLVPNDQIVNDNRDDQYYTLPNVPAELETIGRRVIKAFEVKQRYFHIEFFKLNSDHRIGKAGTIVALEVNMRSPGGYTVDMINAATGLDTYDLWSRVFDDETFEVNKSEMSYCLEVSRRFVPTTPYLLSREEIEARFADKIIQKGDFAPAIAKGMGDYYYIFKLSSLEEINALSAAILAKVQDSL